MGLWTWTLGPRKWSILWPRSYVSLFLSYWIYMLIWTLFGKLEFCWLGWALAELYREEFSSSFFLLSACNFICMWTLPLETARIFRRDHVIIWACKWEEKVEILSDKSNHLKKVEICSISERIYQRFIWSWAENTSFPFFENSKCGSTRGCRAKVCFPKLSYHIRYLY